MKRNLGCRSMALLALVMALCGGRLLRGEDEVRRIEYVFPDLTLAGIVLPDLAAARKAFAASRTGEMYSQPEMRAFLDPVLQRMQEGYATLRTANPLLPALDKLDAALLNGEIAVSVFGEPGDPEPGVLIVLKPKDPAAFEDLLKPVLNGQPLTADQPIPLGEGDEAAGALYSHGRLLVCKPMARLIPIATRLADKAEDHQGSLAVFPAFRSLQSKVKSSAGWLYVNTPALLELAAREAQKKGEKVDLKAIVEAAGLNTLGPILASLDLSGREAALDILAGRNGEGGIFAMANPRPVNKEVLKIAALDAPYVSAGTFDASKVIPTVRKIVAAAAPDKVKEFDAGLQKVNGLLQFDLQKDLLENLESDVALAQTPLDTAVPLSLVPGEIGAMRVKDSAKVAQCLKKAMQILEVTAGGQMPAVLFKVGTIEYKGTTVYYVSQLVSGSHALAVTKDLLLHATSLNAMKRGLDQLGASSNILSNPELQKALSRVSGKPFDAEKLPASFQYSQDHGSGTGTLLVTVAGIATGTAILAGMAEAIMPGKQLDRPALPPMLANIPQLREFSQRPAAGIVMPVANAIDLNLWPDEAFFAQYRTAHGSVTINDASVWHFRTELPPPMPNFGSVSTLTTIAAVSIVASLTLPVLGRARESAKRVSSASNLGQIAKACIMYEDANHAFPTKASDLYPKYVNDLRIFKSPRVPDNPWGYTLVLGVTMDDNDAVLAFETNKDGVGRNVVYVSGAVEFQTEDQFSKSLQQTEAKVKKAGGKFELVPLQIKDEEKKQF